MHPYCTARSRSPRPLCRPSIHSMAFRLLWYAFLFNPDSLTTYSCSETKPHTWTIKGKPKLHHRVEEMAGWLKSGTECAAWKLVSIRLRFFGFFATFRLWISRVGSYSDVQLVAEWALSHSAGRNRIHAVIRRQRWIQFHIVRLGQTSAVGMSTSPGGGKTYIYTSLEIFQMRSKFQSQLHIV